MLLLLWGCEAVVDLTPDNPHAGTWTAEVEGFADFGDTLDEAYCVGELEVEVDAFGEVVGSGICTLQWGPFPGEELQGDLSGTLGEAAALHLVLDAEERGFEPADFDGPVEGVLVQDTTYQGSSGDPVDARLEVLLFR